MDCVRLFEYGSLPMERQIESLYHGIISMMNVVIGISVIPSQRFLFASGHISLRRGSACHCKGCYILCCTWWTKSGDGLQNVL